MRIKVVASGCCCELPRLPTFLVPEITPELMEAGEPGAGFSGKSFCSPGGVGLLPGASIVALGTLVCLFPQL